MKNSKILFTSLLIVFIVVSIAFFLKKQTSLETSTVYDISTTTQEVGNPTPAFQAQATQPSQDEVSTTKTVLQLLSETPPEQEYELDVLWHKEPMQIVPEAVGVVRDESFVDLYEVGVIQNGTFSNKKVYHWYYAFNAPAYLSTIVLEKENAWDVDEWLSTKNLPPDFFTEEKTGTKFYLLGRQNYTLHTLRTRILNANKDLFSEITKPFYNDSITPTNLDLYEYSGCIFAKDPGGILYEYSMETPFFTKGNRSGVDDISFRNMEGVEVDGRYEFFDRDLFGKIMFCSSVRFVSKVDRDFTEAGVMEDGTVLYELRNKNDPILQELYAKPHTKSYDSESGSNKYSYDEFLATYPILFWKDKFGRWIALENYLHTQNY